MEKKRKKKKRSTIMCSLVLLNYKDRKLYSGNVSITVSESCASQNPQKGHRAAALKPMLRGLCDSADQQLVELI